ncbi:MAG TPA: histidinol dehydrogenase, partial [Alphaproteobacteria bacterium]|nr:histidinol dehydrogenase [Alphaproteobacteria bacterium]
MAIKYIKKATMTSTTNSADVQKTVQAILNDIETGGDSKALEYAVKFDNYKGNILLTRDEIEAAKALVPNKIKQDIIFAHDNVRRFAEVQRSTLKDVELEIVPGLMAGQKTIPVDAAGCYIPGGRYSHIASAIMTVTTAKVAGGRHITACSPP